MRYDRIESLLQSIRAHIETQNHTQRDARCVVLTFSATFF